MEENKKEFFHRIKASFLLFSIFGIPIHTEKRREREEPTFAASFSQL